MADEDQWETLDDDVAHVDGHDLAPFRQRDL